MSQAAKAQEPSMEEILASIRRIIADDDAGKPARPPEPVAPKPPPAAAIPARPAPPAPPPPVPAVPPPAAANKQSDIDAMLADLDKPKPAPKVEPPKPAPPAGDVLDLTEAMTTPPPGPAPTFRTIGGESDVVFTDRAPEAPRALEEPRRPPMPPVPLPHPGLMSNTTAAAVESAFNALAHTVLGQNARTLEDLVKEMLRPMLKSWIDDNLPGLVDRIVRAEIERVSRGKP
jgi:cell pole-organizing protein PopZ